MQSIDTHQLETRAFPGPAAAAALLPAHPSEDERPFYEGLDAGRLAVQHCSRCGRPRFPMAPVCPYCSDSAFDWRSVQAHGNVHSWVRYHRSYLPEFEPVVPYVVLTVELAEHLLMFGRLVEADTEPEEGMPVRAIVERWSDGRHVLAFTSAVGAHGS